MVAVRFRDRLHFLLGFSSGAVLAVALFDILPEVFALGGPSYMPIVALGFLAFFGLERYTALHRAREHVHTDAAHEPELGALSAAGLVVHSFLDGVAIGVGFKVTALASPSRKSANWFGACGVPGPAVWTPLNV